MTDKHSPGPVSLVTTRRSPIHVTDIDFWHRRLTLQIDRDVPSDNGSLLEGYLAHCLRCGFSKIVLFHDTDAPLHRGTFVQLEDKYNAEIESIPRTELEMDNDGRYRTVRYTSLDEKTSILGGDTEYRVYFEDFRDAIDQISEFVLLIGHSELLDAMTISRTRLGLTELLSNTVEHATFDEVDPAIEVRLSIRTDSVRMRYNDNAREFNSSESPKVDISAVINQRKKRGLGLHLLSQMADQIEYERTDNWNVTTFTLNRRSTAGETEAS